MNSINRGFIVAALGAALSAAAFAQNPGAGSSNPNQNEDGATTTPSRDRTRPGVDRPAIESTNPDANTSSAQDRDVYREDSSRNGDAQPRKKRSLWDRILGRNKPADAENTREGTAPADTDASGRRIDRTNE